MIDGVHIVDFNNTAFNDYVLCLDCEYGQGCFVSPDQEFDCSRWSSKVKNVGICKYYKRSENGKDSN